MPIQKLLQLLGLGGNPVQAPMYPYEDIEAKIRASGNQPFFGLLSNEDLIQQNLKNPNAAMEDEISKRARIAGESKNTILEDSIKKYKDNLLKEEQEAFKLRNYF